MTLLYIFLSFLLIKNFTFFKNNIPTLLFSSSKEEYLLSTYCSDTLKSNFKQLVYDINISNIE